MKISIVIPAHNEERRIGKTLEHYACFFQKKPALSVELLVVLNGCTDDTASVVQNAQKQFSSIRVLDLKQAGKGFAITAGFTDALSRDNEQIGFVDADMATAPEYFCELTKQIGAYDGIIASRYMPASQIFPVRPPVKEWGRVLVYNPLIWLLFGMQYKDFQCGAKLFQRRVIEKITPYLTMKQWAFDVDLLYLCKKNGFMIKELPTVWHDRDDSKFRLMRAGPRMLGSLFKLRFMPAKRNDSES